MSAVTHKTSHHATRHPRTARTPAGAAGGEEPPDLTATQAKQLRASRYEQIAESIRERERAARKARS